MQTATPWLSLAIWIPIVFGVALLAAGRDQRADVVRSIALAGSLLGLLVTLPLYTGFDASSATPQTIGIQIARLSQGVAVCMQCSSCSSRPSPAR
jgi:NADH:ubiquinone oxidoreductase subunit 4 (subunit M)